MKKVIIALILIIIYSSIVSAQQEYNNYSFIEANVKISSEVNANYEPNSEVEYFKAKSNLRTMSDNLRQVRVDENYNTFPAIVDINYMNESILFSWMNQKSNKFSFTVDSNVIMNNEIAKIKSKIRFPPENIPNDMLEYTKPTEFIDVTPEIKNKANELVEGQTDYYKAVFAIGEWVEKNINYSLDTITEDAVQKSSWVIQNKYGVCDELTNLFISMLRSVGIPARFISGVAYSNIANDFGSHGWAEVYFPEYGWVPFDITFKQFGWVDPTHVKIREQYDSGEPAVEYSWKSRGADFKTGNLTVATRITRLGQEIEPWADISVESLENNVGLGSYVPIMATVKNKQDYYLPISLSVRVAPQLIGNNTKHLLLAPNEERNVIWIVKVEDNSNPDYIYAASVQIADNYGDISETNITFAGFYDKQSLQEAEEYVTKLSSTTTKEFLPNVAFSCLFAKDYFYEDEKAIASCTIENTGNTKFENMKVCMQETCKESELSIGDKKIIDLESSSLKSGKQKFSIETNNLARFAYYDLKVIEDPQLKILQSEPETVNYGSKEKIVFHVVTKKKALNTRIEVENGGTAFITELNDKNQIFLSFDTRDINSEKIKAKFTYEDETGRKYVAAEKEFAQITGRPWYATVLYHLRRFYNNRNAIQINVS